MKRFAGNAAYSAGATPRGCGCPFTLCRPPGWRGGALCQPALAGQRRHRRRLGKRPCAVAEV